MVVSPYLQRPLRTLEQAHKVCGRAREPSAMIVTLPRGRKSESDRYGQDQDGDGPVVYPRERFGVSA
jgi:hypothetical protein